MLARLGALLQKGPVINYHLTLMVSAQMLRPSHTFRPLNAFLDLTLIEDLTLNWAVQGGVVLRVVDLRDKRASLPIWEIILTQRN